MTTATSDYPNVIVEWSPTTGPDDAAVWNDISQYVRSGKTKRGKQYELDRVAAGELTLELVTTTRLFDPENTAGTYYGQLIPMKQIRVTSNWSSTTYSVFQGFVTDWGSTQPDDKSWVTEITAKDAFERFDQIQLPSSAWALEVATDDPDAWFRVGETGTARMTDSSPNGNYGVYDNCQQGQQGLIVNDADGAVSFAHSLEERAVIQNPNLITGYPFTISCMTQLDGSDPHGYKVIFSGLTNPSAGIGAPTGIQIASDNGVLTPTPGSIMFYVYNSGAQYVWSSIRTDDDTPHHISVTASTSSTTSWTIYVDGTDVTTRGAATTKAWPGQPSNGFVIGNYTDLVQGDYGFGANADGLGVASQEIHRGTIDEVCVWNGTAVSSVRVAAQAAAAFGWDGDQTGDRLGRFLDAINWPSASRDIQTGISTLGPASWSVGATALSVMQSWADTELGLFFMSADNKVTFKSRHSPLLDTTSKVSQTTFSDNASPRYQFVELPRDAAQIRNPVTAGRRDGITVTVTDSSTSSGTGKYGPRNWVAPTSEENMDSAIYSRAQWLLSRYKELGTRLGSMTLRPRSDPTNLWPQALGRVIGDRITVKRTPLGLNSQISLDFIIEGVEHEFGIGPDWKTTFVGAPVDPNVGNYLILDDAADGLLDAALLGY